MKFNMTMTAAEIIAIADIANQIIPDSVDLNEIMPAPGKSKITTIKNQKILLETYENSDVVSCQYDLDPDFMVAVFEMLGGFAGNITGACKALMKHGKLLMSLMGAEEIIQKINGMTVGKDCDFEGNPINEDTKCDEESCEEDEEEIPCGPGPDEDNISNIDDTKPQENEIDESNQGSPDTPIENVAKQFGFNV